MPYGSTNNQTQTWKRKAITFSPAECCPRACDDPMCPYMHHDSWHFGGTDYPTKEDAEAAKAAKA